MDREEILKAIKEMEASSVETAKAKEKLDAKVFEVAKDAQNLNPMSAIAVTDLLNMPYDAEVPCPNVIDSTAKIERVEPGMTAQYYTQTPATKIVYTITAGSITQVAISPNSPNTLSFSEYGSDEAYLTINDLLTQKYDSIAKKAKEQQESLNRKENKDMIALYFAAAESVSNTFANSSGDTKIDFEVLVKMKRALAKYGKSKFVLISGSSVTTDLELMDYSEDKNRAVTVESAGVQEWIKVEAYTYTHSTSQTVMPSDRAILVATSDAEDNRPAIFARRKMPSFVPGVDARERLTVAEGPKIQVGSTGKYGFALGTMESYAGVVVNAYCFAAYLDASSYTNL